MRRAITMAKRDEPKRTAKKGSSARRAEAKRAASRERVAPVAAPIAPYLAVGLSTVVYGVGERKHIKRNLQTIEDGIHAAMGVININMPIRIVALAEGALTGFTDEAFDIPHVTAARELFIDIPGEETEQLAGLAKAYDT